MPSDSFRKAQANAILEDSEFVQSVLDASPALIYVVDAEGRMLYVNRATAESFGLNPGDFIGRLQSEVFHGPEAVSRFSCIEQEILQTGVGVTLDETVRYPNGELRSFQTTKAPFTAQNGVGLILGISIDVTERKRAEEERLRILDLSLDLVCILDKDGHFRRVSRSFESVLGYSLAELVSRPFLQFVHPDDRHRTLAVFELLKTDNEVARFENRYLCKSGEIRHLEWSAPAPGREGSFIFAVARDVTERKAAQEELSRLNTFLNGILDNAPTMLFVKDSEMRVQLWNRQSEEMTGVPREEIIGRTGFESFPKDEMNAFLVMDRRVLQERVQLSCEETVTHRVLGQRTMFTTKLPILNPDGSADFLVGITQDITYQKQAERELKESAAKIEESRQQIEIQRQNLLQNSEALKLAKATAEAASKTKSEFLANMSHEIRTPMNAVLGMTRLALETDLTGEQREYLQTVESSAASLLTIINDILDFSKIEAGRLEVLLEPFSLRDFARRIRAMLTVRADEKHLRFSTEIEAGLPDFIIGDQNRLGQVLINLVGNAIKFTPRDGEVRIIIKQSEMSNSAPVPSEAAYIQFRVQDTGIGISPDKTERIFEAFAQADASTTRKFGGTGLGLSISKNLVGLMGGNISVESLVGVGSTFTVNLPLIAQPNGIARDSVASASALVKQLSRPLRVLVAEDNQVNQRLITRLLEKRGCQVTVVETGLAALEAVTKSKDSPVYDVVLMDCQMPLMSGFEATRLIREYEASVDTHIPIIAMTANALEGDQEKCFLCGMDDYISKPIDTAKLIDILNRWSEPASA